MSGEDERWSWQVTHTLRELERRLTELEAAPPAPGDRHHARLARAAAGLERHAARLDDLARRVDNLDGAVGTHPDDAGSHLR